MVITIDFFHQKFEPLPVFIRSSNHYRCFSRLVEFVVARQQDFLAALVQTVVRRYLQLALTLDHILDQNYPIIYRENRSFQGENTIFLNKVHFYAKNRGSNVNANHVWTTTGNKFSIRSINVSLTWLTYVQAKIPHKILFLIEWKLLRKSLHFYLKNKIKWVKNSTLDTKKIFSEVSLPVLTILLAIRSQAEPLDHLPSTNQEA